MKNIQMMGSTGTKQKGAVLAVTLMILLMLTLIVVSGNEEVLLQEKMSSAVRDTHISLATAEASMTDAAAIIDNLTGTSGFSASGTDGYYSKDNGPIDMFASAIWADAKTITATTPVAGEVAKYFIEDLGIIPLPEEDLSGINMLGYGQTTGGGDVTAFKVAARATGQSGSAERLVITYYGKRL